MKEKIVVRVDRKIADGANAVFAPLGLSAETAISMFLAKTAQLGRLPFSIGGESAEADAGDAAIAAKSTLMPDAPASATGAAAREAATGSGSAPVQDPAPARAWEPAQKTVSAPPAYKQNASRGGSSITHDMVECVWAAFKYSREHAVDFTNLANSVQRRSGMNSGSAYIYLMFLNNLVEGRANKRNIKIADLEFLLVKIREELGEGAFANACASVRASIKGWSRINNGYYAQHAQSLLKRLAG